MDVKTGDSLVSAERSRALTAALWFRSWAVVVIAVAAGFRDTLAGLDARGIRADCAAVVWLQPGGAAGVPTGPNSS